MRAQAWLGIFVLVVGLTSVEVWAEENVSADAAETVADPGAPSTEAPSGNDGKTWEDVKRQAKQVYPGEEGFSLNDCKGPRKWVRNGAPHFGHHACGAKNDDGLTNCQIDCGENTRWHCSAVQIKNKGGYGEQCSCCEYPGERLKPKRKATPKAKSQAKGQSK